MRVARKVDPKIAQAIEEDMAQIDNKEQPKSTSTSTEKSEMVPCDCSGGPGKNKTPETRGTGLIDDHTLCPKCDGEGVVPVAQG